MNKYLSSFVLFLGLVLSTSANADNVRLKFNKLSGQAKASNLILTNVQTKLQCHFIRRRDGGHLIRTRLPLTRLELVQGEGEKLQYKIHVKKGSLTEFLPGFDIHSCAVALIILGKDVNGKNMLGDVVLVGNLQGETDPVILDLMQDREQATEFLTKRLNELELIPGQNSRGKYRIIEKPL